MTAYEQQILNTEKFYDQAIKAAEQEGLEILTSVVPGSRLHEVINNTVDSGIDEGRSYRYCATFPECDQNPVRGAVMTR